MAARKKTPTFDSGDSFALESTSPDKPKKESKKERVARLIAEIVGANKEWQLETVDFSDPNRRKTCLEVDFPIVPINEIAQIEGNAGKPIYQMSKWWARRRSSVFRSMLLAAATKAPDDEAEAAPTIWKAYYGNHQKNEEFRKLKVADIFMGGGTTLVEGSRLGFELFGCDLNPVAWFVVKNELTPVDLDELKRLLAEIEAEVKPFLMPYFACDGPGGEKGQWFKKQGNEWQSLPPDFDIFAVSWEDRPQYRYEGPEIIYTFWAKHGPCSAQGCGHRTPLLTTPVMAIKELTVPAWLDQECPECDGKFDIERFAARMAPDSPLAVATTERPFVVLDERGGYACPHCEKAFTDRVARLTGTSIALGGKAGKKKIALTLLMHPQWLAGCGAIDSDGNSLGGSATDDAESTSRWYRKRSKNLRMLEFRGTLSDVVTCPETGVKFHTDRRGGNVPGNGKFTCAEPSCGRQQETLQSIKGSEKTGPKSPFIFQGFSSALKDSGNPYGGRFFALASDPARSEFSEREWESRKENDLADFWPRSELCYGFMTHMNNGGIPNHGYTHWWKMFNPVQLLAHSQILKSVQKHLTTGHSAEAEAILGAFQQYLRNQNLFTIWDIGYDKLVPMLSNNNFHPKATSVENNVFNSLGRGNWSSCVEGVQEGMDWSQKPWETVSVEMLRKSPGITVDDLPNGRSEKAVMRDRCLPTATVGNQSCTELTQFTNGSLDLVITDPPFGGLLHYSELSDFFYVWLRLALKDKYPKEFGPDYVPKALEAVANRARQGSVAEADAFYQRILTDCWREAHRVLKPGGILSFTFHHSEDEPWVAVLESLFEAGFYLEATYPIRSDETKGEGSKPGTFGSQQIEYDIIHVCRKQTEAPQPVSWARLRRRIAADVQQLQSVLTHHREQGLPEADMKVIRRGKALEYFSKHYGQVYVEEGRMIDLRTALAGINQILDDEHTPPGDVPPVTAEVLTRQFVRLFTRRNAVPRDDMQKTLRGTGVGPADFEKKGWCKEEKKIFQLVHPLDWARGFKGASRSKLSRDLDQTLFLIGACWPESGIRVNDTLGSANFKHHPAIPDLLAWFVRHGADFETKGAAANALKLYQDWMERNKPEVNEQLLLFGEEVAA
jgi:SAM-dependent methyltransferase